MQLFFTAIILLLAFSAHAGKISGRVSDEKNQALPFVSVYLEGTSVGTTTNFNGEFFIDAEEGVYRVVFRFLGYATEIRNVEITPSQKNVSLSVSLKEEALQVRAVEINAQYEDAAYQMIRSAQKMRKFYLRQVEKFSARAYIKGNISVKNLPKKILGQELNVVGLDKNGNGIIYLSESLSDYYFQSPDLEKEVVISSKVSGQSKGFSWNSVRSFNFNFYENNIETDISERKFLSPIASTAMLHYDYKYLGEFDEKGVKVNKIAVSPKMKGAPLFKGMLYLQEDTWRIHGVDFTLTKDQNIEYVDSVRIKQTFLPVKDGLWMKTLQTIEFSYNVSLFKISGKGVFLGTLSDFKVGQYQKLPEKQTAETSPETADAPENKKISGKKKMKAKQKVELKKIEQQLKESEKMMSNDSTQFIRHSEKFFSAELIKVLPDANQNNLQFWDSIRPVPLTEQEKIDYKFKDSVEIIVNSEKYLDSTDARNNRFRPINLLTGYAYRKTFGGKTYYTNSFLDFLQFNTVEGIVIAPALTYSKYDKDERKNTFISAAMRYGVSRQKFYGKIVFRHRFNAVNSMFLNFEGGHSIFQYNSANPISAFTNTLYSLIEEQNFLKMYEKTYGKITFGREILNGLILNAVTEFAERKNINNANNLPNIYRNVQNRDFSSNHPQNPLAENAENEISRLWALTGIVQIRPGQKFASYPSLKIRYESKFPVLTFYYTRAIAGVLGSNTQFEHIRGSLRQEINLNMLGNLQFELNAGFFSDTTAMYFADNKHFMTSQTIFSHGQFDAFYALPYYTRSATRAYAEGHFEHHFGGFILNKIPLLKKLRLSETAGFHFLYQKEMPYYWEANFGLDKIAQIFRLDYVLAKGENQKFAHYIRLHIKIR